MNTKDILLFENGDGGQLYLSKDDIQLTEVLYNQFYLALFGGNYEAVTTGNEIEGELRSDYWANSLIWPTSKNQQLNSTTERVLDSVVLNSAGRLAIEQSVKNDLAYLKNVINFTENVYFDGTNNVVIEIKFSEKTNQQERVLQLVYDNAKKELIINKVI